MPRNRTLPTETIEQIKSWGFRVYMRKRTDSWAIVASEDGIAYIELAPFYGFNISTEHKPDRSIGTGFQWYREDPELTPEKLHTVIRQRGPAFGDPTVPNKYKDIEEYRNYDRFNSEYTEV